MLRCYYSTPGSEPTPLKYYLVHRLALRSLIDQKRLRHIHPIPLRGFVAKRFKAHGDHPDSIVKASFNGWVREFVGQIARIVDSMRVASPNNAKHLLPQPASQFLPAFWISVTGDAGKSEVSQFVGNVQQSSLRPLTDFDADAVENTQRLLANHTAVPLDEASLALATTFAFYGYLGLALVQVSVACESVIAKAYEAFLVGRGVSRRKYRDAERDISYSQLLNLHLAAFCDLSRLPDHQSTIDCLNWARNRRNEVVHQGDVQEMVSHQQVTNAIDAAKRLILYVKQNMNQVPLPSANATNTETPSD